MSMLPSETVDIAYSPEQMRYIYRVLNLSEKLENGQADLIVRPTKHKLHIGDYGDLVRTQILDIKIASNGYTICVAHRMVDVNGEPLTEPDPKFIHIDDLELRKKP